MKIKILTFLLMAMVAVPVLAEKPEWAGKGKPDSGKERADKAKMKAKDYMDEEHGKSTDKMDRERKKGEGEKSKGFEKQKDKHAEHGKSTEKMKMGKQDEGEKLKGLEKQREMKMEQEQKELGKGSEQGQETREKSKKWWKFWGE